jgi:retron-type reverse transcriptase
MGLKNTEKKHSYYKKVKRPASLRRAWEKVHRNGIKSKAHETRKEIKQFADEASKNLRRIYDYLHKEKFKFQPAKGILQERSNKDERPIVKSQIPDRIVQRSILDVLQAEPKIREYILIKTSFGGIEKRSVKDALKVAYEAMSNGAEWYIRSDIKKFFTKIPKENVLRQIESFISDKKFLNLLREAVKVELENLSILGKKKDLFPIYDIGVAQGCCLSPLIGNILLHNFDIEMNKQNIICLRYIDDFIILGPSQKEVTSAFRKAEEELNKFNLSAYNPFKDSQKAKYGKTSKGFEFLGCNIRPGLISPSKKSRNSIISKAKDILKESIILMSSPKKIISAKRSFIETLTDISNLIIGWGNQYSFCNDMSSMKELDKKINEMLKAYFLKYKKATAIFKQNPESLRHLLGVRLLIDHNKNPIIKKAEGFSEGQSRSAGSGKLKD